MKRYCVTIHEDLAAAYWVEAPDASTAEDFIREKYEAGDITLTADDYVCGSSDFDTEESYADEPNYVLDESGKEVKR